MRVAPRIAVMIALALVPLITSLPLHGKKRDTTDETVLAKIAVESSDVTARYAAAGRIQDLVLLREVAGSQSNRDTRMKDIFDLRELLVQSGALREPVWIQIRVQDEYAPYSVPGVVGDVAVKGQSIRMAITTPGGRMLAQTYSPAYLPDRMPGVPLNGGHYTETNTVVDLTSLLIGLFHSWHYSPSQIREAMIRILVTNKGDWFGAMDWLKGGQRNNPAGYGYPNETALHWAASEGDKDLVALLIENGADVNAKDHNGVTPLHAALLNGRESSEQVVDLLLAKGARVNEKDDHGATPLHEAAVYDEMSAAVALLAAGADVNAQDNQGQTPLDLAKAYNYTELANLLRQHGGHG